MQSVRVPRWEQYLRPARPLMTVSVTSVVVSVPASPMWSVRTATAAPLTRGTSQAGWAASAATATASTLLGPLAMRWGKSNENQSNNLYILFSRHILSTQRHIRALNFIFHLNQKTILIQNHCTEKC